MYFSTGIAVWIVARYCRLKFSEVFVVVTYFVVLSAVFSFLVVGLVLQRGCVYLLLGVDTVRHFVLYCFVHRDVITVRAYG